MDAGGRVTAVWYIVTFVKPAKSQNQFANAATSRSAVNPRKWFICHGCQDVHKRKHKRMYSAEILGEPKE